MEEVLTGDGVEAEHGGAHYTDGALWGVTVGGVSGQSAHNLCGGQAGTAPLDEVVGDSVELIKQSSLERVMKETTMGWVVEVNVQKEDSMVIRKMVLGVK